jgi:magnesium-transporting ATPase (P-type)
MTKDETTDVGLLSSAQVHQGSAIMVVTAVGLNTRIGFLSSLLGAT